MNTSNLPFGQVGIDQEHRYHGSRVRVAPILPNEKPWTGSVYRILNGGSLLEISPDGYDTEFRISGDRIEVLSVADSLTPSAVDEIDAGDGASDRTPPCPGRYAPPAPNECGTVAGQHEMCQRGARVAHLKQLNQVAGRPYSDAALDDVALDRVEEVGDFLIKQYRHQGAG